MIQLDRNLWEKKDRITWFIKGQYSVNQNMRFKTSILGSNLCDYNDAYMVVKGSITVKGDNDAKNKIKC